MKNNNLIIGSHISLNKKNNYLVGAVQETINNDANCFMIFTGAPQNKNRIPIKNLFLDDAKKLAKNHNIDFANCVVHAPYIINLCVGNDEEKIQFNIDFLTLEIVRTVEMGIKYIVLHPGYHNNQSFESGMNNLIKNLNQVLKNINHLNCFICLETMAGKKNQLGKTIEELQMIIKGCNNNNKLAVCLDTCHMHDAGYDLSKKNEFLSKFDDLIGKEKIKVIHIGDSMNKIGSKKDRHANLGYGYIGFENVLNWIYDEYISSISIIVETPYWIEMNSKKKKSLISPYKHEIQLIKCRQWSPMLISHYKLIFNIYDR